MESTLYRDTAAAYAPLSWWLRGMLLEKAVPARTGHQAAGVHAGIHVVEGIHFGVLLDGTSALIVAEPDAIGGYRVYVDAQSSLRQRLALSAILSNAVLGDSGGTLETLAAPLQWEDDDETQTLRFESLPAAGASGRVPLPGGSSVSPRPRARTLEISSLDADTLSIGVHWQGPLDC